MAERFLVCQVSIEFWHSWATVLRFAREEHHVEIMRWDQGDSGLAWGKRQIGVGCSSLLRNWICDIEYVICDMYVT